LNNFLKRSLTGIAFVTTLLAGTIIHPIGFAILFAAILFFALSEFYNLAEKASFAPQKKIGIAFGVLFFVTCFLAASGIIPSNLVLIFIPLLLFVLIGELFRKENNTLKNSAITIAGLIYVALPFSLLNFIVLSGTQNSTFYPWILTGLFFIIWVYDSMAYIFGSLLGKHKIATKISPKKSWEGLIGGTIFAVIMGIVNAVLFQEISMINWIVIAILAVIFGTLGDFFESKFKRELNIKDSGNILPGHGGLLDRFDSLLFAAPVVFVWLSLIDKI
jgi:phosphatidate cytidylyltransferase